MLHNAEEHKNCFCHQDGGGSVVVIHEFTQESQGAIEVLQQEILFVLQGGGRMTMEYTEIGRELKKGEFVFLPGGSRWLYHFAKGTRLMLVQLVVESPECHALKIHKVKENGDNDTGELYALKVNKRMQQFIEGLQGTIADGLHCRLYMQTEVFRLLFLLHAYYSPQECSDFFSHVLTHNIKFSEFVRLNHTKYRTVREMAEALFMTTQAFSSRFKRVFGMTPYKWMQRERARQIYLDICRNDMPLKEIVIKYDFPLASNFFRFCKQSFGDSPGNIRKKLHKESPQEPVKHPQEEPGL